VKFVIFLICQERFLLFTINKSNENMYCGLGGQIFTSLNKFLQESLLLHTIVILIALFCILKLVGPWEEFCRNIIP
jgi:hypothetical protein